MNSSALYWKKEDSGVRCVLCPRLCLIQNGKRGFCGVRSAENGSLSSRNFGVVSSFALDPIEKKPLYHFYPGSKILSVGTYGCNMRCPYCQNWTISQKHEFHGELISSEEIIEAAIAQNSIGIAYTYSEPIVWIEQVLETALLAKKNGLRNVMVSNGMISREPLLALTEYIDAWNIDLKSFREDSYRSVLHGNLESVKQSISLIAERNHLEITTLAVTGFNDSIDEMTQTAKWIASIDKKIPWHVSRYFPNYQYDAKSTDLNVMENICEAGSNHLHYVYAGNMSGNKKWNDTVCASCKTILVERNNYHINVHNMKDGRCTRCGTLSDIIQ